MRSRALGGLLDTCSQWQAGMDSRGVAMIVVVSCALHPVCVYVCTPLEAVNGVEWY